MWSVTIAIFCVAFVLWILWRKKHFSQLKKLGIPGPEPNLIFGNFRELSDKTPLVCHKEWAKKYGKVFGYYMGATPIVVVADTELLKRIQVSDFHKFINRPRSFALGRQKVKDKEDGFSYQMTALRDKKWKEIRSIITPSFTTSKMRMMAPTINKAIDTLVEKIDEMAKKDEVFDIYKFYQGLTMDVIGRTAFGIQTNCQRDPDDPFLRSSRALFGGNISSWTMLLAVCFPELSTLWSKLARLTLTFRNKGVDPIRKLIVSVKAVIKSRRSDVSNRRNDLLQLMIDAQVSDADLTKVTGEDLTASDDWNEETEKKDNVNRPAPKTQKSVSMEDHEIFHNAILFLLAGYETTSTSLAFVTHFLVHFPEIQERVREEITELMNREGKLDYASVQKLQYLDQVMNESIRMYPPIYLFVNRETGEDIEFGKLKLKKGLMVQVPTHLIQHDADYWPDPETFNPDRFSPESKAKINQLAFQAFGNGPRNCVGMRFAQMEEKLALARILHKYRLVRCSQTDKLDLKLKVAPAIITPRDGINLKAELVT